MMKSARWIAYMLAGMLAYAGALISFGVPADLPFWRPVLGTLLFCGALLLWNRA